MDRRPLKSPNEPLGGLELELGLALGVLKLEKCGDPPVWHQPHERHEHVDPDRIHWLTNANGTAAR